MYNSTLREETKYSFTPFAQCVDQYAVSYDDVDRYPNPQKFEMQETADINIPSLRWHIY